MIGATRMPADVELRRERGVGEAEARGEPSEDLGSGLRLAARPDHRLPPLEPVRPVGGIEVVVLEVRGRGQHDVAVGHAVGQHHVGPDGEEILAQEAPAHAVLVRVHDDGVVVVDEQRLDRRRQIGIEQVRADVDDIEHARARGHQVGALQPRHGLREGLARPVDEATAGHPELAGQRGQREDRADAVAAVLVALEAIAHADGRGRQRVIPLGELPHLRRGHPRDALGIGQRHRARPLHVRLEAFHVALDEGAVEGAAPLQLGGERPGQDQVGARPERDVQIRLLGHLGAHGIDHHELPASAPHLVDEGHQVQVRPRDVTAPGHDQLGQRHLLRPHPGHRAERPHPRLGADASAQRLSVEERGAELVEEAQVHGAAREHPVRPRVVQREHRLRTVRGDHRGDARVDDVERLVPGDRLKAALALGPCPPERGEDPVIAVGEGREVTRYLGADHPRGERIGARAAHLEDRLVLDGHGEAAGIGAIKGTDARLLHTHGLPPGGAFRCRRNGRSPTARDRILPRAPAAAPDASPLVFQNGSVRVPPGPLYSRVLNVP